MTSHYHTSEGFVNIIGILIITVIGISVSVTLLGIDTSSVEMAITENAFQNALAYADTCTEEALLRVRKDSTYSGESTRILSHGTCLATTANEVLPDGSRSVVISTAGSSGDTLLHQRTTFAITYPPPNAPPTFSRVITQEVE